MLHGNLISSLEGIKDQVPNTVFTLSLADNELLDLNEVCIMCNLLYSWRFPCYSVPIQWLVHGHMTSNNETVSCRMPWAGNIAKTMMSNGKRFTGTRLLSHCLSWPSSVNPTEELVVEQSSKGWGQHGITGISSSGSYKIHRPFMLWKPN